MMTIPRRTALPSLLALLAYGCGKTGKASEGAKDGVFTRVTDKLCIDRGQALLFYTEMKVAVVTLRGSIQRGCKSKKLDAAACVEVSRVLDQLHVADLQVQKKIVDPEVEVDMVAIMTAIKLGVEIASKLI